MNYMNAYEDMRNKSDVLDYSLSYNKDNILNEIIGDIKTEEITRYLNEYPKSNYAELKERLSACYTQKSFVLGSGSEDLIWRINSFILAQKKVGVVMPNFYRIFQTLKKVSFIDIPCDKEDLNLDIQYLIRAIEKESYDAVWLSNPNPITGKGFYASDLCQLIINMPHTLFVIDEASMDSVLSMELYSLMGWREAIDNLIVIRTFSKFYGLPGMRLGYACMTPFLAEIMETMGQVFPVSNLSLLISEKILEKQQLFEKVRTKISDNKQALYAMFHKNDPIFYYSSLSNTVVVRCNNPNIYLWEVLKDKGILSLSLEEEESEFTNSVRLTIHSEESYFSRLYQGLQTIIEKSYMDSEEVGYKQISLYH